MAFYVLDDNKNLVEAYDKEDVLALLEQAIEDGSLEHITENSGFITKIKSAVDGQTHEISFVTQAKYNELKDAGSLVEGAYYFITDDTTAEDLETHMASIGTDVTALEARCRSIETAVNGKKTKPTLFHKASTSAVSFSSFIFFTYQPDMLIEFYAMHSGAYIADENGGTHELEPCRKYVGFYDASQGGFVTRIDSSELYTLGHPTFYGSEIVFVNTGIAVNSNGSVNDNSTTEYNIWS